MNYGVTPWTVSPGTHPHPALLPSSNATAYNTNSS